jgi:tetratricopeptide (TPR) repeat protein
MYYHQQAAQQARNANAYAIALRHLNDALACAEQAHATAEEHFNLLEMRVDVVSILGNPQLLQRDLHFMAQLAGDNPVQRSKLDPLHLDFLLSTGRYAEAESTARQVLSRAEGQGDLSLQAAALVALGIVFDIAGDKQQALACLQGAVDRYQQTRDRHGEAEARSHLANVLAKTEQRASARREFESVLALFEALGDQPKCADHLTILGVLSNYDGAFEDSLRYYRRALEICRSIGYRNGEVYASQGLGPALLALGQVGQAIHILLDALVICHEVGEPRLECVLRVHLSNSYARYVGNYPAAVQEATAGLALARAIGERVLEGMCLKELGQSLLGDGKLDEARQHMESALVIQQAARNDLKVYEIYESMVRLELTCGNAQAARRKLELAEVLCKQFNINYAVGSLLVLRAECLLASGRAEEALPYAQEAIAHAEGKKPPYRAFYTLYKTLTAVGRTAEARQALEGAYQGLVDMISSLPPEDQKMSEQVREHRAILETWHQTHPRRISVRLPRASTPLGRPLRPEEWVEVTWTVAAAEDGAIRGKVARRRARLLRLLEEAAQQGASPAYEHLAQALGVSLRTVSTDIAALQGEAAARLKTTLRGRTGK